MQAVNGQILNQVAQRHNKRLRHLRVNHAADNLIIIHPLIVLIIIHMKQFINNIGKLFGHLLAHL